MSDYDLDELSEFCDAVRRGERPSHGLGDELVDAAPAMIRDLRRLDKALAALRHISKTTEDAESAMIATDALK